MKTMLSKFNEAQEIEARNVAIEKSHHPCACGCGTMIPLTGRRGRPMFWVMGHSTKGKKLTEETRRKISQALIGKKYTAERIAAMSKHLIGRIALKQEREKMSKSAKDDITRQEGPKHRFSKKGVLRDPRGRIWPFINLVHFVRKHIELFSTEDVVWKKCGKRALVGCNASWGLASLFRKKHPQGSWKGWTVAFSIMERAEGGGDLLGRDYATVVELAK